MKTIYKKLFFLVFLSVVVACSSDDSTSSDDDGGNTGENHTYEIMLTASGVQSEYSGSMPNESPIAIYVEDSNTGVKAVTLQFSHGDISTTTVLILGDNGQPLLFDENASSNEASHMSLNTSGEGTLLLTTGNATLANFNVQEAGNSQGQGGFASFTLTFEGTFANSSNGNNYEASGEIVVNPYAI